MRNRTNCYNSTGADAPSFATYGTPAWPLLLSAALFVSLCLNFLAPARVEALRLYRGHPWCERPVISGAARGSGYTYDSTPPHSVTNHPARLPWSPGPDIEVADFDRGS